MTISTAPTSNMTLSGNVYEPTANGANLSVTSLAAALGSANVEVGGPSAGTIEVKSALDTSASTNSLVFDSGGGGAVTVDAQVLTTGGSQTYDSPVVLGTGATSLSGAQVTFDSTVDGPGSLTIETSDATQFDATVGGATALAALSIDGTGATALGSDVTTTGPQSYGQPVTMQAASDPELDSISGSITSTNTLDGPGGVWMHAADAVNIGAALGGISPLAALEVDAASINLGGSVATTAGQLYNGPVVLTADATAQSPESSGIVIEFADSIDGAHSLTVDTGNIVEFDGDIGGAIPLVSLTANSYVMLGGNVSTTGDQTYSNQVALTANDAFSDGNGSLITFEQMVFDDALTMDGGGELDLLAASSPSATVVDAGTVAFVAGGLGSGPVTLNGGTLKWSGNTSDVSSQLTAGSRGGALDTNGNDVTFDDAVPGAGSLTKTGAGTLTLAGSGAYGSELDITGGSIDVPSSATTSTPIVVDSDGTLNCDGGTLNGGVTNAGGTATGAPEAPTGVTATAGYGTASVSFTPGTANCHPVSYSATSSPGGLRWGPEPAGPASFSDLTDGQPYTFLVTATNPIGRSSAASSNPATPLTPDPPTVTVISPADGATFTLNQPVTASYSCRDGVGGTGITSCSGTAASGAAVDTSTPGQHTFAVTATSTDGQTETTTVRYTVTSPASVTPSSPVAGAPLVTPSAPTAAISSPASGAMYTVGEPISASYACQDGTGPGIASCEGTVPSGAAVDTSTPGQHTFTVTAASADGQSVVTSADYRVVAAPNTFTVKSVKARGNGDVTVRLAALHGPGAVTARASAHGHSSYGAGRLLKYGPHVLTLTLSPPRGDRRRLKRSARRVRIRIMYAPTGGRPRTLAVEIKL